MINKLLLTFSGLMMSSSLLAAPVALTAPEIIQQFNAVVLKNDNSSSHVDGRTWVGGDLKGGDYVLHSSTTPSSAYNGLTVMGNASNLSVNGLGVTVKGNISNSNINSGSAYIAGNANNTNFNGGKSAIGGVKTNSNQNGGTFSDNSNQITAALSQASSTNFQSVLSNFSQLLSTQLGAGGTITSNGYGKTTFDVTPNANGVAIFNLTGSLNALVFGSSEFQFNLNGATSLIINSDATSLTLNSNFLGGSAANLGSLAIWNFFNATNLILNSQFGGSILAPNATLTNNQNIEGGVYVNNLNQYAEIHQPLNTTTLIGNLKFFDPVNAVPEPSSILIFGLGLLLMFMLMKKRKPIIQ